MFLFVLIISVAVLFVVKWWINQRNFYEKVEKIGGPKTLPILGNVLDLMSPTDLLPNLYKFYKEHGDIYRILLGPVFTYVFVVNCDLLEYVLSSNVLIEKSHDYNFFKNWLGVGLITAPSNIWRKFRKALTPAFHFKIMEQMVNQFHKPGEIFVKKLNEACETSNGGEIDIYPYVTLYSFDVVCDSAMGISTKCQEEDSEYVGATRKMLNIVCGRIFSAYKQFDLLYNLTPDYQKEKEALKYLHGTTNDVIRKRKIELKDKKNDEKMVDEFGIKEKHVFLDLMLNLNVEGNSFEDDYLRHNVQTIMFAGHDTTASAISFCLYLISQHPDVQERLYKEIKSVIDKCGDTPLTHKELTEMKYLDMVIKESLRIYPSVHLIGRKVMEDFEFDGKVYPKGVTIAICPFVSHRNPKYFPDPERFDPERFSVESQAKRHPYAYIPFSAGPRNCIGQKFALFSTKSAVVKVLKNFELLPAVTKPILSAEIVLKSKNGIPVRLKKRL